MGKPLAARIDRREIFREIKPGPRARMAARLYASAAVPTKKAACEAVGLNSQYLSQLSRQSVENPEIMSILGDVDRAVHDKSITMSAVIVALSRKAANKMGSLIDSGNEHIALKASADILDRNPETSKTLKATVTSFSLDGQDAKELAAALVAGARVKEHYAKIAEGDFVKVKTEATDAQGPGVRKELAKAGNGGDPKGSEDKAAAAEDEKAEGEVS